MLPIATMDTPLPRPLCMVLAAGHGTRMGVPKALMTIRGEFWWRRQQTRLLAAGVEPLWVVNARVADALGMHEPRPWHTVPGDGESVRPMFASVAHAWTVTTPRWCNFILPVDVPCPRAETFASLAAACGQGACVPVRAGATGHPICLSGRWVIEHLCTPPLPDAGTARLDDMTRDIVQHIEVDDPDVGVNLNTPQSLEAWLARTDP